MADEEKFATQCQCVKWHAPKPTLDYEVQGVPVCPVSYVSIQQLVAKHRNQGKVLRKNETGYPRFVRDLATAEFNNPAEEVEASGNTAEGEAETGVEAEVNTAAAEA